MATYYWKGGESSYETEFTRVANWVTSSGSNPAGTSGVITGFAGDDNLVWDGRAKDVDGNFIDCKCASAYTNAAKLGTLHKTAAYGGNICLGTGNLELQASCKLLLFEGTGIMFYRDVNASGGTDRIVVNATTGQLEINKNGASASAIAEIYKIAGLLKINEGARFSNLYNLGGNSIIGALCWDTATTTYSNIESYDGSVISNSCHNIITQAGGTFTHGDRTGTLTYSTHINKLRRYGGIFNWQPIKGTTGGQATPYIKQMDLMGGTMYALGEYARQIGTASGDISYVHSGASLDLSQCTGVISYYSGAKLAPIGDGLIKYPSNTQISW